MYRFVRQPIYFGAILMAAGFTLLVQGRVTLAEAAALALFFDIKSRREGIWLVDHFPACDARLPAACSEADPIRLLIPGPPHFLGSCSLMAL